MIVHINHIAPSRKKTAGRSAVSELVGLVNGAMLSMVEDGVLDARLAPSLRVHLGGFTPYRDCLIWEFNRLFWRHLSDWEAASGKGFEAALPAGSSDANHPEAVAASARESSRVSRCWTRKGVRQRRSSAWRSASARARVPRRGSTAFGNTTPARAAGSTRACSSCSATTRLRVSSGRWPWWRIMPGT